MGMSGDMKGQGEEGREGKEGRRGKRPHTFLVGWGHRVNCYRVGRVPGQFFDPVPALSFSLVSC